MKEIVDGEERTCVYMVMADTIVVDGIKWTAIRPVVFRVLGEVRTYIEEPELEPELEAVVDEFDEDEWTD